MEDDIKPVIQPQRRLNPKVQDVVKNENFKLVDLGLIYPISDSSWVSPIHVVLKKGGMTVVLNDNNELIPSGTVIGWRVCINYHKQNDTTRKDHFPLPFIDQMLERLSGNEYHYFLDGLRMSFGLCNAPATFQRCMTAIFNDMVEDFMELDHSALKYLFSKQDAKPRLIRWVLLLQGFNIEIKDKKGAENLAADHLSRLENPYMEVLTEREITDEFSDEHLMVLNSKFNDDETCVFKDANEYIRRCDACQRSGNISSRNKMPQNKIQDEAQALPTNDARVVVKFLRGLFARFGVPKALISDRGAYFCNSQLEKLDKDMA
ncbi:reverse transcriptase domain-containing protein [Tanacetum coccineum]